MDIENIEKILNKIKLSELKEFLVGPIPHVLLILSSVFVIFSIIYNQFIQYSIVTFFYAVSISYLRLWYKDRIFFTRTAGFQTEEYLKKWKKWNRYYHIFNSTITLFWGVILFILLDYYS